MSPNARHDAQTLLDALPLPSYIYDLATGRVLGANAAFCALLGYSLKEIQDLDAAAFYHPKDLDLMWTQLMSLPNQGTGERRFKTRAGNTFAARVRFRNTELMNAREFLSARLVVVLSHEAQPTPAGAEPVATPAGQH